MTTAAAKDPAPVPCPRCAAPLEHVKREGQLLEVCVACRGLWFDPGELTLLLQVYQRLDGGAPAGIACPRCRAGLVTLPFPGTSVEVDRCPGCQGTWLDGGELETLQDLLKAIVDGPPGQRTPEQAATSAQALALFDRADQARARRFACPRCGGELAHLKREGQLVEACGACGGTWLDAGELTLLVGLYRELPTAGAPRTGTACVRCGEGLVGVDFPGTSARVETCPACRGSWLPQGALEAIRAAVGHLVPDDGKTLVERAQELFAKDPLANPQPRRGCPSCGGALVDGPLRGVPSEACAACGGTWLDSGLLTRVLGVSRKLKVKDGRPVERRCVRCPDQALVELEYPGAGLAIDLCPDCKGTWLVKGRLDALAAKVGAP